MALNQKRFMRDYHVSNPVERVPLHDEYEFICAQVVSLRGSPPGVPMRECIVSI